MLITVLRVVLMSVVLASVTPSYAQQVMLGETPITILTIGKGQPGYVHVHHNETTALQAAKQLIVGGKGSVVSLQHAGGRNISFRLAGKTYRFDPNRMFTANGRHRTLAEFSEYNRAADAQVHKLAQAVITLLPHERIIAIHNNSSGYSINGYLPGGKFVRDGKDVFLNPKQSPHNFFYVTTQQDFDKLRKQGFNVVLQNNRTVTDDGSLSVYAGQHRIPYINVEAAQGRLREQLAMLRALK